MPGAQIELQYLTRHLVAWLTEIAVNNALTFFDINKVSEGTSARLLNLLYGWEQIDLNDTQANYPGIDLGDAQKSMIAIQVTSRTDARKISSTLNTFLNRDYLRDFPNGLRFLILSSQRRPSLSEEALIPYKHFFDPARDIFTVRNLLLQAKKLYYEDQEAFQLVSQFLEQEFGQGRNRSKGNLINFKNIEEKAQFFKKIFGANQRSRVGNFVPIEYLLNGQTKNSDTLLDGTWLEKGLVILGPSGCGKSALARLLSLKVLERAFPLLLESKYYESSLREMFQKEVRAYGFESESEFLNCAKYCHQPVLLILDGLNECTPDLRSKLLLEAQKTVVDMQIKLLITSQIPEGEFSDLGLLEIVVQRPSPYIREQIALSYDAHDSLRKLTPILAVVSTGLEARMVGEMDAGDFINSGRHSLFATFIRTKLAQAHIGGIHLMSSIARLMSEKITFSLSLRAVERLMVNDMLSPQILNGCFRSGILDRRGEMVSFSHEMFFDFFVAESVARFSASSGEIVSALNAPKNADKKILILGAIDDTQIVDEVLAEMTDSDVFDALLDGDGGEYSRLWVERKMSELLPRVAGEIANCEFEMSDVLFHFDFVEGRLNKWSDQEMGLLLALPGQLVKGKFLNKIFTLIGTMDEVCAVAAKKFRDAARTQNISARSNIFSVTYGAISPRRLAISSLFSALHSGFLSLRSKHEVRVESLHREVREKILSPGQVYLLLVLFRYDECVKQLYPNVIRILRNWRQFPTPLLTEILQQIAHIYSDDAERIALISQISRIHSETQNIWLSTQIFDALGVLGALDDDSNEHIVVVSQEIDNLLNKPPGESACNDAASIFYRQYDHPYSTAYYSAIEQLGDAEKKSFIEMALQGWSSEMFTFSLILRGYSLLGISAMKYIQRWTETPLLESSFPSDSLAIFLVSHLLLGKCNYELLHRELDSLGQSERSVRALAEIYYWIYRSDIERQERQVKTNILADLLFDQNNCKVIETIWQCRHALYGQSYHSELDITRLGLVQVEYRERIVEVCRHALLNLESQESIWYFAVPREEINKHAIWLLAESGSVLDLDVLKPLADDSCYGTHAVKAIKNLGG
ncbi:SMEK domain-containing protein [Dyadobacter sp. CY261]|uniref:SMEK domain-containing protein n=1 Tax=Dyadobacter sp. CY261 TaxID=2907203 RepID=UPI001F2DBF1E|nr:SMEK domain-containing protein [Dyadobacter sp. CY261]MCF0069778.1 SMEK domain-containing protein [Dyadobacter sp. CY261]